ncbi:hypothetical protein GYMLUDRAFT_1023753 [Collybiopsis luxurians FD-317 M1]|nr:hypothetical protein GYMLUDRAFT_1023753 [Collybiopsis luxurians FD-317 M1]
MANEWPSSQETIFFSQQTSSTDTVWDNDELIQEDNVFVNHSASAQPSESAPDFKICKCTINAQVLWHPADIMGLDRNFAHITGFTMHIVLDPIKIKEPDHPTDVSVAVIQGLDIGYFHTWSDALPHICVLGAVYSVHNSVFHAQVAFMHTLLQHAVCFIYGDGIFEAPVCVAIPAEISKRSWWISFWHQLGGAIPSLDPNSVSTFETPLA